MSNYKVCVIGGWCGNRMVMVAEHLEELLGKAGLLMPSHHAQRMGEL